MRKFRIRVRPLRKTPIFLRVGHRFRILVNFGLSYLCHRTRESFSYKSSFRSQDIPAKGPAGLRFFRFTLPDPPCLPAFCPTIFRIVKKQYSGLDIKKGQGGSEGVICVSADSGKMAALKKFEEYSRSTPAFMEHDLSHLIPMPGLSRKPPRLRAKGCSGPDPSWAAHQNVTTMTASSSLLSSPLRCSASKSYASWGL